MQLLIKAITYLFQLKMFEGYRGYLGMLVTALAWGMEAFPGLSGVQQIHDLLLSQGVMPEAIGVAGLYITYQGYKGAKAKKLF